MPRHQRLSSRWYAFGSALMDLSWQSALLPDRLTADIMCTECQHQAASKHQKARLKLDSIWPTKSDINDVVAFQADIGLLAATWISRWAQRPPPAMQGQV